MKPLKIFIGYDPAEMVAMHVCMQSIMEQATVPVEIIPLGLKQTSRFHFRDRDPRQTNDFTYIRFLVPYLCGYQGRALFMDCDMALRADPAELFQMVDERYAVSVVKHNYEPRDDTKWLGKPQYAYPRKNWSSFVLWNCAHPSNKEINPYKVDKAEPKFLHRFAWLKDDEIGEIPVEWNWLVGEYPNPPADVKNAHWTLGVPSIKGYENDDFADEYFGLLERANYCIQADDLEKEEAS